MASLLDKLKASKKSTTPEESVVKNQDTSIIPGEATAPVLDNMTSEPVDTSMNLSPDDLKSASEFTFSKPKANPKAKILVALGISVVLIAGLAGGAILYLKKGESSDQIVNNPPPIKEHVKEIAKVPTPSPQIDIPSQDSPPKLEVPVAANPTALATTAAVPATAQVPLDSAPATAPSQPANPSAIGAVPAPAQPVVQLTPEQQSLVQTGQSLVTLANTWMASHAGKTPTSLKDIGQKAQAFPVGSAIDAEDYDISWSIYGNAAFLDMPNNQKNQQTCTALNNGQPIQAQQPTGNGCYNTGATLRLVITQ